MRLHSVLQANNSCTIVNKLSEQQDSCLKGCMLDVIGESVSRRGIIRIIHNNKGGIQQTWFNTEWGSVYKVLNRNIFNLVLLHFDKMKTTKKRSSNKWYNCDIVKKYYKGPPPSPPPTVYPLLLSKHRQSFKDSSPVMKTCLNIASSSPPEGLTVEHGYWSIWPPHFQLMRK